MAYALCILAAGKSSRMGVCKLDIQIEGKSLLEHIVLAGLESKAEHIVLVSGAFPEVVNRVAAKYNVSVVHNDQYESGMASSILCGIGYIEALDNIDGIIISVADQYYLSSDVFNQLIQEHQSNPNNIIACSYQETIGVPCLFPIQSISLLNTLSGDMGAKKLLQKHQSKLRLVSFEKGRFDLDVPTDIIGLNLTED